MLSADGRVYQEPQYCQIVLPSGDTISVSQQSYTDKARALQRDLLDQYNADAKLHFLCGFET